MDADDFAEKKGLERIGINFVKTVLELSGYRIMDYGIESHNQEITSLLKRSYKHSTNIRLLSTPDLVAYDSDTRKSHIIEVKYRKFPLFFNPAHTNIAFRYLMIKQYMQYWPETIFIVVMNVKPFCLCVDLQDIDWNKHYKGHMQIKNRDSEIWNFNGSYKLINQIFNKVTRENFLKALDILL